MFSNAYILYDIIIIKKILDTRIRKVIIHEHLNQTVVSVIFYK
jgi:hypothetical protein